MDAMDDARLMCLSRVVRAVYGLDMLLLATPMLLCICI